MHNCQPLAMVNFYTSATVRDFTQLRVYLGGEIDQSWRASRKEVGSRSQLT